MNVLVIGSGGREQAIAWACRRHGHHVTLATELPPVDGPQPDLVIPGPEAVLVAGIADECARREVPCFGPTAELARLESSKGFARHLSTSLGIPGPAFAQFDQGEADEAKAWIERLDQPVVVKADGLAGGKGVAIPDTFDEALVAVDIVAATGPFVLEERMTGPELSLLALCDGSTAVALPLAQDHKRIGEGDTGPNTGGMGAYAPAPVNVSADELVATFVQPILDHYAEAGTPYVGVIYAGLMLTPDGPRLVEYNVRFGDPETQAVLPLLESDLASLALAATTGTLGLEPLHVRDGAACSVVAAAAGYPSAPRTGDPVFLLGDELGDDAIVFPAGVHEGRTSGGRVLTVTGLGPDLAAARAAAYDAIEKVAFPGMQFRRDIAWRAPGAALTSYAAAGVDITEGNRAVSQMKAAVERTHGADVVRGVGSFGGAFSAKAIAAMTDPVLVASTDGVGTKVELAAQLGRVGSVGHDIVNHCIGDVLVQSARPLFFLDYIAASRLDADMVAAVVTGMAEACEAAGCTLLGGETAEMPGVYAPGAFDVAGTLVGVAERDALLPRDNVVVGDLLVGIGSSGPHTNGYSLLRKVFEWIPMDVTPAGLDRPLGDALLEPHRNYLGVLTDALTTGAVKALAHITGGGLIENVPRVLPPGVGATIQLGSWPVPPLFELVRELAPGLDDVELHRTLNMGIGMVVVCAVDDIDIIQATIPEPTWVIGELTAGSGVTLTR
ncbi:phosphoribosylamine--glycine ligase [Desertimonas flava]|uniref:phosphoribosylamine--glycine ligase n=1 Tax=Desertimonas flava TaxID=2064846 RepID=UPI0019697C3C|nr:phosphoribosylamine--glycine ligase [Desertimonas flava]